jgi:hypothetical protein
VLAIGALQRTAASLVVVIAVWGIMMSVLAH